MSSNVTVVCSEGGRSWMVQFVFPSSFMSLKCSWPNSVRLTASFGSCAWSMKVLGRLV